MRKYFLSYLSDDTQWMNDAHDFGGAADAVPDLLAACQGFVRMLHDDSECDMGTMLRKAETIMTAAIAKAEHKP